MLAGEPPFTGPTPRRSSRGGSPSCRVRSGRCARRCRAELERRGSTRAGAGAGRPVRRRRRRSRTALVTARDARRRSRPPSGRWRRRPCAARPAAATSLAVLAALVGVARRRRGAASGAARGSAPALDASLVAVAPFDVLDPALALWREGLVDLLSRNLDGAGPLRTRAADDGHPALERPRRPSSPPPSWAGAPAPRWRCTARCLAPAATRCVSGPRSTTWRAAGRSTSGKLADQARPGGPRRRLAHAPRAAGRSGRTRAIGAVQLAGFGSTSLPALKAFLQGEQLLRRTSWDSALVYYERAIALDSALRRRRSAGRARVLGWSRTGYDSLSTAYALRAGAHNHGLLAAGQPARPGRLAVRLAVRGRLHWPITRTAAGACRLRRAFSHRRRRARRAIPMIRRRGFSSARRATTFGRIAGAPVGRGASRRSTGPSRSILRSRRPISTRSSVGARTARRRCAATSDPTWRSIRRRQRPAAPA